MIRKIIVGLDQSAVSLKALQQAITLAKGCNAELQLVHVLVEGDVGAPQFSRYFPGPVYPSLNATLLASYQTAWNEFVDHAQALLDQQVAEVRDHAIEASGQLLEGNPGAKLCELAQTWQADVLMVGSRGLAGISELLIGSVSNYVLHHAPCSVVVVHGNRQHRSSFPPGQSKVRNNSRQTSRQTSHQNACQETPPKRILVPLDKSDTAKATLKTAKALATLFQADIRLLHVIDEDEPGLPQKLIFSDSQYILQHSTPLFLEYQQEWNKFINGWWEHLQGYVDEIEAEGLDAISDVMQGRTGQRICEVAQDWQADLIVMGCRGLSGLQELLVGSVSYYVSHRASCSVWVARPSTHAVRAGLARELAVASA